MNTRVEPLRAGLALLTTLGLVIAMMMVFTGPADAASVEPELKEETANQTCAAFEGDGQTWIEFKVDPNADGVFTDGTLIVTISNTTNDKTFDWSSNIGVDAVFVKAGDAGSYLYRYDPPSESTGDTGLTSPGEGVTNQISHISFCYDIDDPSTVEFVKDWDLPDGVAVPEYTITFTYEIEGEPGGPVGEGVLVELPFGATLDNVEENLEVTLPDGCSVTDSVVSPTSVTAEDPDGEAFIITVTNTVECEPEEPTTTTVADTTTTTVPATTTTTVGIVEDTTTTTIPDEVAGTVITTSTIAPVDEVLDTHVEAEELPFTGIDTDQLVGMAVLLLAGGLVLLGVTGRREDA